MVVLALPFAYLHFRSGNITGYVFIGVLVGISFFLLNNVFGFIGNLRNWEPWLAAAAPGVIYSVLSLAAFGWLVLRQKQDEGERHPDQAGNQRADEIAPAGKVGADGHAHQGLYGLGQQ